MQISHTKITEWRSFNALSIVVNSSITCYAIAIGQFYLTRKKNCYQNAMSFLVTSLCISFLKIVNTWQTCPKFFCLHNSLHRQNIYWSKWKTHWDAFIFSYMIQINKQLVYLQALSEQDILYFNRRSIRIVQLVQGKREIGLSQKQF